MLLPNSTIWDTRIQAVDAVLTASANDRNEVYYLATVCQVGIEPPLVSISPNPEYPICDTIHRAGFFAVNFLGDSQGGLIERTKKLDKARRDKLLALELEHEVTDNGTPMLVDCLRAIECRVERSWDDGDHRTFIGEVVGTRVGAASRAAASTHRFGGYPPGARQIVKKVACRSGVYDLAMLARGRHRGAGDIEAGTARYIGKQVLWTDAAAGETRPPDHTTSRAEKEPPRLAPSPPGVCLVGCGWWGEVHAIQLRALGSGVRRFFASRNIERARSFANRFDGEGAFAGLSEALADDRVHAVILALPHSLHAQAAVESLSAGRHVLVEKPIALDIADAEQVVAAAERSGTRLAVAEQYRLSPLVLKARELLRDDLLGRVTVVQAGSAGMYRPTQGWKQAESTMGGGVLLDVGVHYVDMLRSLFGEPGMVWAVQPPQLAAEMEGEDSVLVSLTFGGGLIASLTISWSAHRSRDIPNIEVIGERGSLGLWFSKPYLVHSTPLPASHWASRARRSLPWRISRRIGRYLPRSLEKRLPVEPGDLIGSRAIIEDFVNSICSGAVPAVSGVEGLRDLRIVKAAYQSLETGAPQSLNPTVTPLDCD